MQPASIVCRLALLACFFALQACSSGESGNSVDAGGSDCGARGCAEVSPGDVGAGDATIGDVCEFNADCVAGVCDAESGRCVAPCRADADCGPTRTCADDGQCVSRATCTDDATCGAGEACNRCLGVCQATSGTTVCDGDVNCGFEEFCESCLGRCLPRRELCEPCSEDRECGEVEDRCLDYTSGGRYCGRSCGSCPVGYICGASSGQCVALSGSCEAVRECETASDCPLGRVCSGAFQCVVGCTDDGSCTAGLICQAGECRAPCTSAAECPVGADCVEGRCAVEGGCLSSEDCDEAQTYCDRNTLMCVSGCEVDNDCLDAGLECIAGDCVPRGCRGNYSCAFGQVCDVATGVCSEATGPYCDRCNGDDIDSCGAANVCASLQDDGEDVGAFCFVACDGDPDNRCPQGYGCQDVEVEAGDVRSVCARTCNREPV